MSEQPNVTVADNPQQNRYEATDESGVVAGFAEYQKREGRLTFIHTEVDDAYEGEGVGSTLAREALDHARTTGLEVRSSCKFISAYVEKHPEYQDVLGR